jgi:hypothetical protein
VKGNREKRDGTNKGREEEGRKNEERKGINIQKVNY